MPEQAKCRSCGASILWVKTEAGKAMPLDAAPDPTGNVLFRGDGGRATVPSREEMGRIEAEAGAETLAPIRYTSHFATCPQAAQHRRKGN